MSSVYFMKFDHYIDLLKIGKADNISSRSRQLAKFHGQPVACRYLDCKYDTAARMIEAFIHRSFMSHERADEECPGDLITVAGEGYTEFFIEAAFTERLDWFVDYIGEHGLEFEYAIFVDEKMIKATEEEYDECNERHRLTHSKKRFNMGMFGGIFFDDIVNQILLNNLALFKDYMCTVKRVQKLRKELFLKKLACVKKVYNTGTMGKRLNNWALLACGYYVFLKSGETLDVWYNRMLECALSQAERENLEQQIPKNIFADPDFQRYLEEANVTDVLINNFTNVLLNQVNTCLNKTRFPLKHKMI